MTKLLSLASTPDGVSVTTLPLAASVISDSVTNLVTVRVQDKTMLYAYARSSGLTDIYEVTATAPFLTNVKSASTDLNLHAWTILRSFTLGNKPYLMGYEAEQGNLAFYEINSDYSLSQPYIFMNQRSWPTQNFTEVTPFVSVGLMYVLCYDGSKGTVAIFSLDVVASSAGGIPPLNMLNVWYHQWAKNWEEFAFFQLGQSNFFFKINKGKLNVNIDHILDSPALGSVEIGSYLQEKMPNAQNVTLSATIPWQNGEPYLATYDPTGKNLDIYRIHADCQGWTKLATTSQDTALQMLSFQLGGASFILIN